MQSTSAPAKSRFGPFRFRPVLTLAVLPALALLFGLGTWQVQRHFWKQDLIDQRSALQAHAPSQALWQGETDLTAQPAWQRYAIQARIRPGTLFLQGSDRVSGIPGRFLYGLADVFGEQDKAVILSVWTKIGFVAQNNFDRVESVDALALAIGGTAVARADGWRGQDWLKPVNDPVRGLWAYIDTVELDGAYGVQSVKGHYLQVEQASLPTWIVVQPLSDELPNNHWHYALTWYSLALILVLYWVLLSRQPIVQSKGKES